MKEQIREEFENDPSFDRSQLAREIKSKGDKRTLGSIRVLIVREIAKLKQHTSVQHPDKENIVSYSAIHPDTSAVMNDEEFCDHFGLDFSRVRGSKIVTHQGTPYWNITFSPGDIETPKEVDLSAIISKHIKPVKFIESPPRDQAKLKRLIISDVHIGMEIEKDSLFGGVWDKKELFKRLDVVLNSLEGGGLLHVIDLGDLLDGYDNTTVRKGHDLPQNMDNLEQFDVGLEVKMYLLDNLVNRFEVEFHNICNDNHAGWFGGTVNSAFKTIADIKYGVKVFNYQRFIEHYTWRDHTFVLTHGKDAKALKFGFKPHVDEKQIGKIDGYLKQNGLYKKGGFVEFNKGDSHQALFDHTSSDDFNYFNYPSFSPQSNWVQSNFKKGRSGFVIQEYREGQRSPKIEVIEF